jgi:hypothetical protein
MVTCAEAPELYLLPVRNITRITVSPLHWHFTICICVDKHVETAVTIELRKKRYGCCDLAEDGLYLFLDLFLGLFWCCFGRGGIAEKWSVL